MKIGNLDISKGPDAYYLIWEQGGITEMVGTFHEIKDEIDDLIENPQNTPNRTEAFTKLKELGEKHGWDWDKMQ